MFLGKGTYKKVPEALRLRENWELKETVKFTTVIGLLKVAKQGETFGELTGFVVLDQIITQWDVIHRVPDIGSRSIGQARSVSYG